MKKILFCVYGLGIGGIEKCLVNLVNALDPHRYDITVAVMNPEYDLLAELRTDVTLISFESHFVNTTDTMPLLRNQPFSRAKIAKFAQYIIYRLAVKLRLSPWKIQSPLPGEYDIAVAYTHVGHVPNFVLDRVRARRKILWYHTLWVDPKCASTYARFDQIVAVSQNSKENFLAHFPSLAKKVSVLYNLYDLNGISLRAQKRPKEFCSSIKNIVTVGRLSPEKGYDLAIEACALLKKRGIHSFRWYWIGDGPARKQAEASIQAANLSDIFILSGNQTNPYPYMKYSDLYVQTSRREAFCTTIIEAKSLHKPIISTQNGSISEQLSPGYNGIICQTDAEDIAKSIAELLADDARCSALSAHSQTQDRFAADLIQYDSFFLT